MNELIIKDNFYLCIIGKGNSGYYTAGMSDIFNSDLIKGKIKGIYSSSGCLIAR